MASPQTENGYTAIANELFDALCRTRIPGEVRQVVDVVLRKTYGFKKKEDAIALSQFEDITGMWRSSVYRAICLAEQMNLISKKATRGITLYRFNKDFETWRPLEKKKRGGSSKKATDEALVANTRHASSKYAVKVSRKSYPQKKKETITKETVNPMAKNRSIDEVVGYLKAKLGVERLDGSEAKNRRFAHLMLQKLDPDQHLAAEKLKKIIDAALSDKFHVKNTTDFRYIYYNAMKIVASAKIGDSIGRNWRIVL